MPNFRHTNINRDTHLSSVSCMQSFHQVVIRRQKTFPFGVEYFEAPVIYFISSSMFQACFVNFALTSSVFPFGVKQSPVRRQLSIIQMMNKVCWSQLLRFMCLLQCGFRFYQLACLAIGLGRHLVFSGFQLCVRGSSVVERVPLRNSS